MVGAPCGLHRSFCHQQGWATLSDACSVLLSTRKMGCYVFCIDSWNLFQMGWDKITAFLVPVGPFIVLVVLISLTISSVSFH